MADEPLQIPLDAALHVDQLEQDLAAATRELARTKAAVRGVWQQLVDEREAHRLTRLQLTQLPDAVAS